MLAVKFQPLKRSLGSISCFLGLTFWRAMCRKQTILLFSQVHNLPADSEEQNPAETKKNSSPPVLQMLSDKIGPKKTPSPEELTPRMPQRHQILDLRLSVELDESHRVNSLIRNTMTI